jgi:hypothetical protein
LGKGTPPLPGNRQALARQCFRAPDSIIRAKPLNRRQDNKQQRFLSCKKTTTNLFLGKLVRQIVIWRSKLKRDKRRGYTKNTQKRQIKRVNNKLIWRSNCVKKTAKTGMIIAKNKLENRLLTSLYIIYI